MQRHLAHFEAQVAAGRHARGHQVDDDFVLRVDRDRVAGQFLQVDAVALAAEGQFEAVVQRPFAPHALADAGLVQDIHAALLEHAGADGRLDVGAAARFQHDRFDALQVQQVG